MSLHHLALLGDSIFDNAAYTDGGPAVLEQVRAALPASWSASLQATDGAACADIAEQLRRVPPAATHLAISVGGNDAMLRSDLLDTPTISSGDALLLLHRARQAFETSYHAMLADALASGRAVMLCTIYHGNFPEPDYRDSVAVALAVFNDVIIRAAVRHRLPVVDLREVCVEARDFANPIEPSSVGGAKIAQAVVDAVSGPAQERRGATISGA